MYVITATATISNCHIANNTAPWGGGLYLYQSAATLTGNYVINNAATRGGGLLLWYSDDAMLTGNHIISNTAYWGGGLYLDHSENATLTGNHIIGNTASNINGAGGGLYMYHGSATLTDNQIGGNAAAHGGGLFQLHGHTTLTGNTVSGNAANYGGGVYLWDCNTSLQNDIVADNVAGNDGGGLYILAASPTLRHLTVARNQGGTGIYAGDYGGAYSHAVLTDTILVSHTVGIYVDSGNSASLQATLWGSGAWANVIDYMGLGITIGTVNVRGDPAFVNPAAGDYHILPTSAAVDAGVDAGVTTDIDGDARPSGKGYDIGADEYLCHALTTVTISGPTSGYTNTAYAFEATVVPPTATTPITYTWSPTPTAGSGAQVTYTWATTGTHVVTVRAENCGGVATATHTIVVRPRSDLTITKAVVPTGRVAYGDPLTYTLLVSGTPGATVGVYDPLTGMAFLRFVVQPAGVVYDAGAVTGTLMLTPTAPVTVSFVARVGVPGTVGWTVEVRNRACVYPAGGTPGDCVWSNTVTNEAIHLYGVYLPLVLRQNR